MNEWGSWKVFLIGVGLLFVMLAPQTPQPMMMIIFGLVIVLMGVILLKKTPKKRKGKYKK